MVPSSPLSPLTPAPESCSKINLGGRGPSPHPETLSQNELYFPTLALKSITTEPSLHPHLSNRWWGQNSRTIPTFRLKSLTLTVISRTFISDRALGPSLLPSRQLSVFPSPHPWFEITTAPKFAHPKMWPRQAPKSALEALQKLKSFQTELRVQKQMPNQKPQSKRKADSPPPRTPGLRVFPRTESPTPQSQNCPSCIASRILTLPSKPSTLEPKPCWGLTPWCCGATQNVLELKSPAGLPPPMAWGGGWQSGAPA